MMQHQGCEDQVDFFNSQNVHNDPDGLDAIFRIQVHHMEGEFAAVGSAPDVGLGNVAGMDIHTDDLLDPGIIGKA